MPTSPELIVVGRVRKAHGVRGELVVEPLTDAPGEVFAPGRRLFAEVRRGESGVERREVRVVRARPFKAGWLLTFDGVADRNEAELWRERQLLAPSDELTPPADGEVYIHDLIGLRVQLISGDVVGRVTGAYELPQGLMLEVDAAGRSVLVPFREGIVTDVDVPLGVVTIDPPEGLV